MRMGGWEQLEPIHTSLLHDQTNQTLLLSPPSHVLLSSRERDLKQQGCLTD